MGSVWKHIAQPGLSSASFFRFVSGNFAVQENYGTGHRSRERLRYLKYLLQHDCSIKSMFYQGSRGKCAGEGRWHIDNDGATAQAIENGNFIALHSCLVYREDLKCESERLRQYETVFPWNSSDSGLACATIRIHWTVPNIINSAFNVRFYLRDLKTRRYHIIRSELIATAQCRINHKIQILRETVNLKFRSIAMPYPTFLTDTRRNPAPDYC